MGTVLTLRVHDLALSPTLHGICVGYERGTWRADALASELIDWIPDFALAADELQAISPQMMAELIRRAANAVYKSGKKANRGEIGELLLHVLLRELKGTIPAISKIYFKDSANDTVKGFDAVHVVADTKSLELWLGEVKFYRSATKAIADVGDELRRHTTTTYLRSEFAAIVNKLSPTWPHRDRLARLLSPSTSLDDVFDCARVPVLLTYESTSVAAHKKATSAYVQAFEAEVRKHHATFANSDLPKDVTVDLFLVPMADKATLVDLFDKRLKAAQTL